MKIIQEQIYDKLLNFDEIKKEMGGTDIVYSMYYGALVYEINCRFSVRNC
jgi:hypothetical protein